MKEGRACYASTTHASRNVEPAQARNKSSVGRGAALFRLKRRERRI